MGDVGEGAFYVGEALEVGGFEGVAGGVGVGVWGSGLVWGDEGAGKIVRRAKRSNRSLSHS